MGWNLLRRVMASIITLLVLPLVLTAAGVPQQSTPFCPDANCIQTRQLLKNICDFIVKKRSKWPTFYQSGYYMRTLVAGYEIFGDRRYLDTAISYGDYLLSKQMPSGFWPTGYSKVYTVYLADTGSMLGLFAVLYKHVDHERQKRYLHAVQRYVDSIHKNGMIHNNGALGVGWLHVKDGKMSDPVRDQYTLSSALTGGIVYTWMYHITKQDRYREVAYNALRWILSTMRRDGNIPYVLAMQGADWAKRGDPKTDYKLWEDSTYGTSAYVGEGVLTFDLYCNQPSWKAWIKKAVRPNIDFLLRNQLPDGTWSKHGPKSWDRTRSPGIINYLIWYYEHVYHDPRIVKAVQRWDAFVLNPQNGKSYGLLNEGAHAGPPNIPNAFDAATEFTALALADIISPGVDAKW